jgi:diadenosine tetraphosphate (Ap4A) HIT family hydrolase
MQCVYCHPAENLIVTRLKNFNIVIDPFPLCEGHVMIISKEHFGCIGEMPAAMIDECHEIAGIISSFLIKNYDDFISFEHGRAGICIERGIPCSHMHLHFLPAKVDVTDVLSKLFNQVKIENLKHIPKHFHSFGEYLYYHSHSKGCYLYLLNSQSIPPHYMRTVITGARAEPHLSDWETYQNPDLIRKNLEYKLSLRRYFANDLP